MKEFAGKHILMVVENLSVPFDKRVWRESVALRNAGAEVSVICASGTTYDSKPLEVIDGIRIYRYKLPAEGIATSSEFTIVGFVIEYTVAFLKTFFLSIGIYLKHPFHVIHVANPPDIFFIIGLLYKPLGVKFVFDHHDVCPEGYLDKKSKPTRDLLYRFQLLLEKLSFWTANIVVSTNESYRNVAMMRGKKEHSDVFVVRNGPDTDTYKIQSQDQTIRGDFKYLVGYIGVMAKLDGVDYLIRAADYVVNRANRTDIGFILIGSGTSINELKDLTNNLRLTNYVRFTGRIPDDQVFSILSTIDISAAPDPPSRSNNISTMNKIMDYMWFGKPIVSFDLVESRRSAQDAAVYVTSVNAESFGQAIIDLIDNPDQCSSKSEYGRRRVKSLTWQESEKVLISAYRYLFSI
jgi:glycosyltransferase involved in cell wall biosynthesis